MAIEYYVLTKKDSKIATSSHKHSELNNLKAFFLCVFIYKERPDGCKNIGE